MKARGQNGLIGQTQLELDGIPDISLLQDTSQKFGDENPLLNARVGRSIFTMLPCWHENRGSKRVLNLNLWAEEGFIGESVPPKKIKTAHQLAETLLNTPLEDQSGVGNLRLDLLLLKDGGSILFFTWSHILFDGKGAELLVRKFLEAAEGKAISKARERPEKALPLIHQLKKTRPATRRFFDLIEHEYVSLSGKASGKGRFRYKILKFDQETTKKIQERAVGLCGLFSISFYLACAVRAHRKAFLSRGMDPSHYVNSIPVQVRPKTENGDPFQNRVSVLFFLLKREQLDTLKHAVQSAQSQFEEMTRSELGPSFEMLLRLMRRLPGSLYMKFLGAQFSGTIASFFHSFTGAFPFDNASLCGVRVSDARHVPSVSAPPGSGLFFSESHGCLTAVFSWRDVAVTEVEADLILQQLKHDLMNG